MRQLSVRPVAVRRPAPVPRHRARAHQSARACCFLSGVNQKVCVSAKNKVSINRRTRIGTPHPRRVELRWRAGWMRRRTHKETI
jgi:hypothetical protein